MKFEVKPKQKIIQNSKNDEVQKYEEIKIIPKRDHKKNEAILLKENA